MKIKDTESTYMVASKTAQLMGDIVGSPALGTRIVNSLLLTDENPTERNIQCRLREALNGGYLQVKGLGPKGLKRLQSALLLGKSLYLTSVRDKQNDKSQKKRVRYAEITNQSALALRYV